MGYAVLIALAAAAARGEASLHKDVKEYEAQAPERRRRELDWAPEVLDNPEPHTLEAVTRAYEVIKLEEQLLEQQRVDAQERIERDRREAQRERERLERAAQSEGHAQSHHWTRWRPAGRDHRRGGPNLRVAFAMWQ